MRGLAALRSLPREDVAAWVQRGAEGILLDVVRRFLASTGARRVALAGGVFANVLVNGKVAALPGVERVHVFPHMGDGGLAAGAALHASGRAPEPLGSACLGPEPTEGDYERAAWASGLPVERPAEPDAVLVDALARGLPVARCVGAMEFGPRALGHRSILAPAHDPATGDALNRALARDDFMPFAPALRVEDAPEAFDGFEAAASAARHMTVALPAREGFRRLCPGAVHVDGTARPQAVSRDEDPELHRLLAAHAERTGRPAVVNTSFNRHEEPIVNTPTDAVRAFREAGLPLLRLGPFVVRNPASAFG
jgi:carbamoyltransferase